jgi:hypothetical protein
MIVREIVTDTEKTLETFDWFNDYSDTRRWAARNRHKGIVDRLDEGFFKWHNQQNKPV